MPLLIAHYPALKPYLSRLGSRQIRTMGTLGGNIGTASPIGDMPPVLLALEARLTLVSARGTRDLALEEFFLGYRKTALAPDEVIQNLTIPKLWRGEVFFCDKLSKRRDQDISTVAAGYRLRVKDGRIEDVRIGLAAWRPCPSGRAMSSRRCRTSRSRWLPSRTPLLPSPATSSRSTIGAARSVPAHRRRQPAAPAPLAHRRARARGRGRGAVSGHIDTARRHDSALKHVTGQALYIDDVAEPPGPCRAPWC